MTFRKKYDTLIMSKGETDKDKSQKGDKMNKMNATEVAIKEAKDNRTREILIIVKESKDLKEAEEKIKALLEK